MSIGFKSFHLQYSKLVSFHAKSEQLSYFANGHIAEQKKKLGTILEIDCIKKSQQ